ncbi:MAG TPA: RagB/SusD family nutrient uptake outer membrane protein [Tenuifilaceae bacterium]|nr:RagB/SusD family nutrient uptake outer membrane protein [Tenuifilaceae bacterium]HPJ44644.1 RagB/SusD family nutrient uptake outer membrane protein [Tenuifilaceae bacterium]HPQ35505.1 RagB/SusD family nutrient uptake outer membrane protein [Tenuifilaceae bacterium]
MKRILLIVTALTLSMVACTDLDDVLYDRVPEDQYTPDPVVQMVPIYKPMQRMIDDNGNWWFAQEITGDGVVCPVRGEHWDDGGKWRVLHDHTWDNNVETINRMWSVFYEGATEANIFIEKFTEEEGEEVIDNSLAKAKIMRAYYYYLLIDNYGDVPYVTQYLNADPAPSKTPRATIFNSIVEEIEENIPKLPYSTAKTAVTKGMAFTLLAKLYLNHAVYTGTLNPDYWEKAEIACDSVIALEQYNLETDALAPFITNNDNSPENIFVIPFDEDTYQGFRLHMRTLHYNSNLTFDMLAGPWNGFAVIESHYNTYEDGDRRKEGFLVGQQYDSKGNKISDQGAEGAPLVFTTYIPHLIMTADNSTVAEMRMSGARVIKFEVKKGAKENLSNDFPIFRYGDVLLMKAEAMIRQGKNGDEYVNQIRNRAGLEDWSNVTLDMLLEERGREMFWEGHRRQDMIRFGKFNQAWWEKPATDPSRNVFPIPQWAIDANPNLGN